MEGVFMAMNLLHAPVVLSRKQRDRLVKAGIDLADVPHVIGKVSMLGERIPSVNPEVWEIYLFVQSERIDHILLRDAYRFGTEKVFGTKNIALQFYETNLQNEFLEKELRLLVKVPLNERLRNRKSFIHSMTRRLGNGIVAEYLECVAQHREAFATC